MNKNQVIRKEQRQEMPLYLANVKFIHKRCALFGEEKKMKTILYFCGKKIINIFKDIIAKDY